MLDRWQAIVDRFGALSTRERVLVLIALFAVAYQVGTLVVFDRQFEQIEQLTAQTARDNAAVIKTNQSLAALSMAKPADPNRQLRESIEAMRTETHDVRAILAAESAAMISPQDMARFLEELLVQERELSLVRLKTLEASPVMPDGTERSTEAATAGDVIPALAALHRHGFEVEFSGSYLATLRYLEALEELPWRFFWDSVDFSVVDYPESTVRLRLYTLSLSEDWIGV